MSGTAAGFIIVRFRKQTKGRQTPYDASPSRRSRRVARPAPPPGGVERARHSGAAELDGHAVHRRGHGGQPGGGRVGFHRAGVHLHLAAGRAVHIGRHRLFGAGGPPDRRRPGRRSPGRAAPGPAGRPGRGAGHGRPGLRRQPLAAPLAGRRPGHLRRRVRLLPDLRLRPACGADAPAGGQHAAVQRQHAHPQPAERHDVRAGRGL